MATTWVPTQTFGSRLAMVRRELGWNQKEAATRCGLDKASWSNWERGTARPQNMDIVVEKVAAATSVNRDWLMWGTPPADATVGAVKPPYLTSTGVMWDEPVGEEPIASGM